jgi:SAM-dependent methyltransferase
MAENLIPASSIPKSHWNLHAKRWQHVAPPLRPSAEDIALFETRIASLRRPGLSVLLGVTPEIAGMHWPRGTQLLALDQCMGMIRGVWPFVETVGRDVVCGDWLSLPVADDSCGLVIGDGCFTLLPYPDAYAAALAEIRRVLSPGGIFAMRYFSRPEVAESAATVIEDLEAGRIGNFHILKWRLAMALYGSATEGVSVGAVWEAFNAAVTDRDTLAAQLGWPRAAIDTIDVYRGVSTPYFFPTLSEIRAATDSGFEELHVDVPEYELGERCPTIFYEAH